MKKTDAELTRIYLEFRVVFWKIHRYLLIKAPDKVPEFLKLLEEPPVKTAHWLDTNFPLPKVSWLNTNIQQALGLLLEHYPYAK